METGFGGESAFLSSAHIPLLCPSCSNEIWNNDLEQSASPMNTWRDFMTACPWCSTTRKRIHGAEDSNTHSRFSDLSGSRSHSPAVARPALPWVSRKRRINSERVESTHPSILRARPRHMVPQSRCRRGEIGRRAKLKILFPKGSVGSTPSAGTFPHRPNRFRRLANETTLSLYHTATYHGAQLGTLG